jgi:hypothetical protein
MFLCSHVLLDSSTSEELGMEKTRFLCWNSSTKENLNLKLFNNSRKTMVKTNKCTQASANSAHQQVQIMHINKC